LPTVTLQRKVAVFTPEIFAAFPRRSGPGGLTVADAIGTGFEGTYSYRPLNAEQKEKRDRLILKLAPGSSDEEKKIWAKQSFASLPLPEQSLALLMRTLVSEAPIVILDEIFGGMDDQMIQRASDYLRKDMGSHQAVIFVSHWEHEVPWPDVKRYSIESGIGKAS
jgi:ABC-type molybdenum transport system ATPase subunit/photorepair protein PhrA